MSALFILPLVLLAAFGSHIFSLLNRIDRSRTFRILLAAVVFFGSFILVATSGYRSQAFSVSDGVEYSAVAEAFASSAQITFSLNGVEHPSRYAPWFSMVVLAPAAHLPRGIEDMLLPVYLFAALAGLAAFVFAMQAGLLAGVLAAVGVILLPELRYFAQQPMTDIPAAVAVLFLFDKYCRSENLNNKAPLGLVSTGIIAAFAMALRPVAVFFLLPQLMRVRRHDHPLRALLLILLPAAVVCMATAGYNLEHFGSVMRTGYQYWTAVPYEFPSLVFSPGYILENFFIILSSSLFGLALLFSLVATYPGVSNAVGVTQYTARARIWYLVGALPFFVLHLFYFYPSPRFYLPVLLPLVVLISIRLGEIVRQKLVITKRVATMASLILFVTCAVLFCRGLRPVSELETLREIARELPSDALFISDRNPLLVEQFVLKGTERRFIPYSRSAEYASKVFMPESPRSGSGALPVRWDQHRFEPLYASGAADVYPHTLSEQPELVQQSKDPVFIDLSSVPLEELSSQLPLPLETLSPLLGRVLLRERLESAVESQVNSR